MYSTISFPGLGIEVNPGTGFAIGPLQIHWYGVVITLGLILAVWYCSRRSPEFGMDEDLILDGVLWVTPFAILCARCYYVIFSWEAYKADLISVLYIWQGGLAIYGGVLGAVAGCIVFCKVRKVSLPAVLDLVLMGFLIGQAIGRWGNFFNREAFGAETDSFLRMGLTNSFTGVVEYHHPTFLYESLWNAASFVLLATLSRKRKYDGQIALGYAALYGLGRAMIEGLRTDSLYWGPFRVSQVLAGVSCIAACAVLIWQAFRPHDPGKMFVNRVAAEKAAKADPQPEETSES